jgi:hypothetical protein
MTLGTYLNLHVGPLSALTPLIHWQCLDVKILFLDHVQTPSTFIIRYLISSLTSIK